MTYIGSAPVGLMCARSWSRTTIVPVGVETCGRRRPLSVKLTVAIRARHGRPCCGRPNGQPQCRTRGPRIKTLKVFSRFLGVDREHACPRGLFFGAATGGETRSGRSWFRRDRPHSGRGGCLGGVACPDGEVKVVFFLPKKILSQRHTHTHTHTS